MSLAARSLDNAALAPLRLGCPRLRRVSANTTRVTLGVRDLLPAGCSVGRIGSFDVVWRLRRVGELFECWHVPCLSAGCSSGRVWLRGGRFPAAGDAEAVVTRAGTTSTRCASSWQRTMWPMLWTRDQDKMSLGFVCVFACLFRRLKIGFQPAWSAVTAGKVVAPAPTAAAAGFGGVTVAALTASLCLRFAS